MLFSDVRGAVRCFDVRVESPTTETTQCTCCTGGNELGQRQRVRLPFRSGRSTMHINVVCRARTCAARSVVSTRGSAPPQRQPSALAVLAVANWGSSGGCVFRSDEALQIVSRSATLMMSCSVFCILARWKENIRSVTTYYFLFRFFCTVSQRLWSSGTSRIRELLLWLEFKICQNPTKIEQTLV